MMKRQRLILLLILLSSLLAACSPGHDGGKVIAFVQDGSLWTIDPNGANVFAIVSDETPVVDFAWSPTHQLLVYRTLDPDVAASNEPLPPQHPITGVSDDVASVIHTIGVSGGSSMPLSFSSPDVRYSLPIWTTNESRLLYRHGYVGEEAPALDTTDPQASDWSITQNDQPGGIAQKLLPDSYSIPSLSYEQSHYLALGNDQQGIFTTTLTGEEINYFQESTLPGHPLPSPLERILWRPAHQDQEFVYAVSIPTFAPQKPEEMIVQLVLRTIDGKETALDTCTCRQFGWSPDGRYLLYSTPEGYTLLDVDAQSSWHIPDVEPGAVPSWSPDSRFLLLEGTQELRLLVPDSQQQHLLLDGGAENPLSEMEAHRELIENPRLNPAANSPWSPDGRQLLFLTHDRQWQGETLEQGMYVVTIDDQGRPTKEPSLVISGNITQAGWTYQDANTTFVY